jgi:hypothetical protein
MPRPPPRAPRAAARPPRRSRTQRCTAQHRAATTACRGASRAPRSSVGALPAPPSRPRHLSAAQLGALPAALPGVWTPALRAPLRTLLVLLRSPAPPPRHRSQMTAPLLRQPRAPGSRARAWALRHTAALAARLKRLRCSRTASPSRQLPPQARARRALLWPQERSARAKPAVQSQKRRMRALHAREGARRLQQGRPWHAAQRACMLMRRTVRAAPLSRMWRGAWTTSSFRRAPMQALAWLAPLVSRRLPLTGHLRRTQARWSAAVAQMPMAAAQMLMAVSPAMRMATRLRYLELLAMAVAQMPMAVSLTMRMATRRHRLEQ